MNSSSIAAINVQEFIPSRRDKRKSDDNIDNIDNEKFTTKCSNYWYSFYGIVVVGACIVNISVFTIIPRKNSIVHQEFWYESLMCAVFGVSIRHSALNVLSLYIFSKVEYLRTMAHLFKVFIACSFSVAVPYCISYISWTLYMGYNHPLPFVGNFILFEEIFTFCFLYRLQLRSRKEMKIHGNVYLKYQVWHILQNVPHELISMVAATQLQWILIILVPLARIVSTKVALKIVQQKPETNCSDVIFFVSTEMAINYTSYLTGRISSLKQITVYGLLIGEVCLHMHACYRIIKTRIGVMEDNDNTVHNFRRIRTMMTEKLVMVEFIDAVMPLAFGISFTMAYYGPNFSLMVGIGNNYFGGRVIDDVETHYFAMLQMFGFDFIAVIMSGLFLRIFCRINILQEFSNLMKKHWMIFVVTVPSVAMHFGAKDINFGLDYTGEFLWITEEGRSHLICIDKEISNNEKMLLLSNSTICLT